MDKFVILQAMLDKAGDYDLKMEVLVSLINDISNLSGDQLQDACERALIEWDI